MRVLPLILLATLAGCTAAPPPDFGRRSFVLGLDAPAGTTTVARGAVAPGQAGVLTVSFAHLLGPAQRRLLATIADVDKVTIRIEGTGVDETATILKAAIANGQASHTFTNLPPGALTVTIKALDAAGTTIGVDIQTATVSAGNTATVTSTLRLAPEAGAERNLDRTPINQGSGGSGGGPTTGSLTTDVTIEEPSVEAATYLGAYLPPLPAGVSYIPALARIEVDAAGQVWTPWRFATSAGETTRIATITKAGVVTEIDSGLPSTFSSFSRPVGEAGMAAIGQQTDTTSQILRFDASGSRSSVSQALFTPSSLSFDPDGVAYCLLALSINSTLSRVAPGGEVQLILQTTYYDFEFALAAPDGDVRVGEQSYGDIDGKTYHHHDAIRVRADGSLVWRRPLYSVELPRGAGTDVPENAPKPSLAADGAIWCTTPDGRLVRIAADGTRLPDVALAHPSSRLYTDPAGVMWGYPAADGIMTRFAADGTPAAFYYLGEAIDAASMAVTPDGHVWILEGAQRDLLHFKIAIP